MIIYIQEQEYLLINKKCAFMVKGDLIEKVFQREKDYPRKDGIEVEQNILSRARDLAYKKYALHKIDSPNDSEMFLIEGVVVQITAEKPMGYRGNPDYITIYHEKKEDLPKILRVLRLPSR